MAVTRMHRRRLSSTRRLSAFTTARLGPLRRLSALTTPWRILGPLMNPMGSAQCVALVRSLRRGGPARRAGIYLSHRAPSRIARGLGSTRARDLHLATTRPAEEAKCTSCTTTRKCDIDQIKGMGVRAGSPFCCMRPFWNMLLMELEPAHL